MIAPHCEYRQSGDKCGTPHNVADDYTRIPPEGRHHAQPFIATGQVRLMLRVIPHTHVLSW